MEHTSVLFRRSRSSGYLEAWGWWQQTVPYGSSGPLGIDGSAVAGMMAVVLLSIEGSVFGEQPARALR